jgi:hypothetical protein
MIGGFHLLEYLPQRLAQATAHSDLPPLYKQLGIKNLLVKCDRPIEIRNGKQKMIDSFYQAGSSFCEKYMKEPIPFSRIGSSLVHFLLFNSVDFCRPVEFIC